MNEVHKPNQLVRLVQTYPVVSYYLLTFFISWGGLVFVLGGPEQVTAQQTNAPFLPLYFITVAGPCIAGVVLTGLYGGGKGFRAYISRLMKWRVKYSWYLIALLIAPLTVFSTVLLLSLVSPVFVPAIFSAADNKTALMFGLSGTDPLKFLSFVMILGLFNGFVEELGWTGFLTPVFRKHHSILATGMNIGFIWGLWHLLSNYVGSAAGAGTFPLPLYLAVALFSFLPPFRVLMTWVYEHTGSLLIAIIMHASLDIGWLASMPNVLTGQQRVTWYIVWAVLLWLIVVWIKKKQNWQLRS